MKTINKILLLLFLVCFVSCEIEPELIYEAKIADVNVNALEVTAEFDGPHGSYDYLRNNVAQTRPRPLSCKSNLPVAKQQFTYKTVVL